jgi:hypothetical protein
MQIDGHELMLAHEDRRRRIYEYSGPEGSIQFTKVLELTVLGNHFHQHKDENFEILYGGGALCLQVIFSPTNKAMLPHVHISLIKTGFKYRVAPWEAHAFVLEAGTELVCRSNKQWDPRDVCHFQLVTI